MTEILYKEESYRVIGACMEVYNEMGCGFLEAVYHECLEYEFADRGIPFVSQAQLSLRFKERTLRSIYIPDFLVESKIIVEIKGVSDLNDVFRAQMLNYLTATNLKLGLLINFGQHAKLQYERILR